MTTREPSPSPSPPPVRKPIGRAIALTACGVVLAGMLLVVVVAYPGAAPQGPPNPAGPVTELIAPQPLTDRAPSSPDEIIGELSAETGWIQSVDEQTGEPDQRYRFSRLFPNPEGLPEGWFRMERPEAQIFLSDRRVLYLSGDSALALAPNRALERGTLTGHVRIDLYETTAARAFEAPDVEPILTVLTDEAEFNQELGRIHCAGPVDVETPDALMVGRGVTVQFNDLDRVVERLDIDRLDHVTLLAGARAGASDDAAVPDETSPPDGPAAADADADTGQRDERRAERRGRRQREAEFYVLTLHENVVVRQGAPEQRRRMSGDRLAVIFSPGSEGLEGFALAVPPLGTATFAADHRVRPIGLLRQPLPVLLARLAIALLADDAAIEPGSDETVITCDGRVTMVPLRDPDLQPSSERDAILTLTGAPVRLDDAATSSSAECAELTYRTRGQRVDLFGRGTTPLLLRSPDLVATGRRFWLSQRRASGGFIGAGEMLVERAEGPDAGAEPVAQPTEGPPVPDLLVAWSAGVDLAFAPGEDGGMGPGGLQEAVFRGPVGVRGRTLLMDADVLTIGLTGTAGTRTAIETIGADAAVIRSVGRPGEISGARLDLELAVDALGRSVPTRLVVAGDVEAEDAAQHLWASTLEVTFRPGGSRDAPPSAGEAFGASDVDRIVARDDVQVLSADGIRAFADTLDIDAVAESGVLTGEELLIVRDGLVLERGTRLEFDRIGGVMRWRGPGTARVLATALEVTDPGRIERPAPLPDAPARMRASWSTSLSYDASFNDGAGAIDLYGDVQAETRRTDLEHNTIEGQHITVELAFREGDANDRGAGDSTGASSRAVGRFIARHQARLESRTWTTDGTERKPDVFFVAGEHVEYDDLEGTALVIDEGTLLVRNLPDDPAAATAATAAAGTAPFSGEGTTMFLFTERLELVTLRNEPPRYKVTVTGGVQVSHQALDGRTAAATGEQFEAVFERRTGEPGSGAPGPESRMDLRRLSGRGAVYVRTPERRVECDEFDYDLISGMAQVEALPGRLVSSTTADGERLSAESIEWDMMTGSIRVRRTLGSVDRAP